MQVSNESSDSKAEGKKKPQRMVTMLDSPHDNAGYVSAWLAAHDDHEEITDCESIGSDSGRWTGSDGVVGDHGGAHNSQEQPR